MRRRRGPSCAFSRWIYAVLCFLLGPLVLTNASYFASAGSSGSDEDGAETAGYCHLCERHTMCLFPFDDVGPKCTDVENGDLDPEEIQSIVHQHNLQRNNIARGLETRGNPGPQPPARYMMELTWDEELALLARRWALRCQLREKDECRDVDRFPVWQNVNALDLDSATEISGIGPSKDQQGDTEDDGNTTNTTAFMRIQFHVQSWLDEVEHFDAARVGLVDFRMENETSYVAIAGAKITRIGCGRAVYTVDSDESFDEVEVARSGFYPADGAAPEEGEVAGNKNGSATATRFDVLVCNYGPIDRATPHNLYEYGALEPCPDGFGLSFEYDNLCAEMEKLRDSLSGNGEDRNGEEAPREPSWRGIVGSNDVEEERRTSTRSSGAPIAFRKSTSATTTTASFYVLAELLSLVLIHIITKAPGARCCWSC